jgi:hypothetical protein
VAAADPHPTYLTAAEGNAAYATAAQGALAASAVQPGAIGSSGLTMTAGILGRESGTGAPQVFTLGSGLSIVNGALTAAGGGGGGYPSLSMPTGFSVSGSGTASLGVTFATGYSLPTTAKQTEWDTAYSERLLWDGGSTGLNATTARTSLGLGSAATSATTDFATATAPAAAVSAHEAAADPHPQYLTTAEGNAAYATAAQGTLAATAVQPAGLASTLTNYVQSSDSRLSDSREWSAPTVAQATAEAGISTTRVAYNPLRVFQSIAAYIAANFTATGQALATAANAAAARTTLGLGSAATAATGDFAAASHSQAASTISDSTATGRALLTAADAAAARSAIGAGTDSDVIVIPVGDESSALTTGTNRVRFRMPFAATLLAVRANVNTAPTGSTLIVDVNEAGTSVLGTKLSIDATEFSSTTAASAATITDSSLADDAEISIDIDQIGSTVAGAGLKVSLFVRRA